MVRTQHPLPSAQSAGLSIAHVVMSLDAGGLERVVLDLTSQGQRLDQRVAIVCVQNEGCLASRAKDLGATVLCARKAPGLSLTTGPTIERLLRQIRPDVVHTHQLGALFYSGAAARRAKVPLIVHTEHGKHYEHNRKWR